MSSEFRVKLRSLLLTALMRVPSTAKSSRPNRSSRLHSSVNCRNTDLKSARLSARKSAMVLKSGFSVRSSHMTSMLRWHSASSRRLDRTRLRYPYVELEQIARRVARPTGRLRLDAREACLDEIEAIDEGVDEADGLSEPT